jgi:hypothetical protein
MEIFLRKPGTDPSGRSLDPDEIQPDQDPLHGKRKKSCKYTSKLYYKNVKTYLLGYNPEVPEASMRIRLAAQQA